jgi:hypothetical protein
MIKTKASEPRRDLSGWKGNVFYPDGVNGRGFGIDVAPDGRVWFPMVEADSEPTPKTTLETSQGEQELVAIHKAVHLPTLPPDVTDNSGNCCLICGNPVQVNG